VGWEASLSRNFQNDYRASTNEYGRKSIMANSIARFIFLTCSTRTNSKHSWIYQSIVCMVSERGIWARRMIPLSYEITSMIIFKWRFMKGRKYGKLNKLSFLLAAFINGTRKASQWMGKGLKEIISYAVDSSDLMWWDNGQKSSYLKREQALCQFIGHFLSWVCLKSHGSCGLGTTMIFLWRPFPFLGPKRNQKESIRKNAGEKKSRGESSSLLKDPGFPNLRSVGLLPSFCLS